MRHKTPARMRKPAWHLVGLAVMAAATLGPLVLRSDAGAATTPNDPQFPSQWALAKVRAPQAWDVTRGNTAVKVALVDTGIRVLPDLVGQVGTGINEITPGGSTDDTYGSYGLGTGVAGIMGAATNNSRDVAGVNWNITMVPVKVCDFTAGCPTAAIAAGINWAVANGAQIINITPSLTASTPDIDSAVANAVARGILVVAAAGDNASQTYYPAANPGVIAVGATDQNDVIATFSGKHPTLVAPGQMVNILVTGGCCRQSTGTAFAAGHVSGALALLLSAGVPAATAKTAVLQGAQDLGAAGWDSTYGYGRLDICGALAKAGKACPVGSGTATATPTRTSTPSGSTATPTRTPTRTPTLSPSTPPKT